MECPRCKSDRVVKNGSVANGKRKNPCRDCGRQFVSNPQKQPVSDGTKEWIDRLLLEKIPLAGIAGVCRVSESWLRKYANRKYDSIEKRAKVKKKRKASDDTMRRNAVFRSPQKERALDPVGIGLRNEGNRRRLRRCPRYWGSQRSLGVAAVGISTESGILYGLLGSVRRSLPFGKTTGRRQEIRQDQRH